MLRGDVEPQPVLPLVTTYSQTHFELHRSIGRNFNNILGHVPGISSNKLTLAYRRNKNLKDFLTRAKFKRNPQIQTDCVSQYFIRIAMISNPYSGETRPLKCTYHSDTTNIVYCIICNMCKKLYVGGNWF